MSLFFLFLILLGFDGTPTTDTTKKRLPEHISGHKPTILPILTSDGKRLYLDRKGHTQNTGGTEDFDDIWFSEKLAHGRWSEPLNLGAPLNTRGSDVLCSLSPDNNLALVYGHYDSTTSGVKYPGFSLTYQRDGKWSFPRPITIENFYNRAKRYYASLAPDNRTLLLALERENSVGGLDLYVSFRRDTSLLWSSPLHLGATLNTKGYEGSPCLAADGKTLYFSSEGHGGYGAADLFMTKRLDSTWKQWTEPVNLGPAVNAGEEDSSIFLTQDANEIYFVSSDTTFGKGLYSALLPDSLQPGKSVILSGDIKMPATLSSRDLIPVTITAHRVSTEGMLSPEGVVKAEPAAISQNVYPRAHYALALPADASYIIRATVPDHFGLPPVYRAINTFTTALVERHTINLQFLSLSFPALITSVYFDLGSSDIHTGESASMALVALRYHELKNRYPSLHIEITGQTCDIGSVADNKILARQRAETISKTLLEIGIPQEAQTIVAKGKYTTFSGALSEDVRKHHRRVDIRFIIPRKL